MLPEKGKVKINALYYSGGEFDFGGTELQVSVTPTRHVGIFVNGTTVGHTDEMINFNSPTRPESGAGSKAI